MSDRVFYTIPSDSGLLKTSQGSGVAVSEQFPIYFGYVQDVILDHTHPEYSKYDGMNVGNIKVRIFGVDQNIHEDKLQYAYPLDSTIQDYPLKGELVQLFKILSDFFYTSKIPIANRLQEDALINLDKALQSKTLSDTIRSDQEINIEDHFFGNYFKPDSRVRKLKHFEGDLVIQGRMGQSIRFGSSKIDPSSDSMAPNVILRAGQGKGIESDAVTIDSIFGLTLEDINKDPSSIWMTSDQVIPFIPTTVDAGSFMRSVSNPPQSYDRANIIINSSRVVLNAKHTHVMLFANEGIHLNSYKDTTIDTDSSILLTANLDITTRSSATIANRADEDFVINVGNDFTSVVDKKTSFVSSKIFIGSAEDDREPIVGGTSLSIFLARLILALMGVPGNIKEQIDESGTLQTLDPTIGLHTTAHVVTPMGPGLLSTSIVIELLTLYNELVKTNSGQDGSGNGFNFSGAPFNSRNTFITLHNEVPEVEPNAFQEGIQETSEINEWKLSDSSVYKVI